MTNLRVDHERGTGSFDKRLEATRVELESTKQLLSSSLNKKADSKDLDRFFQLLNKKGDIEFTEESILQMRGEVANELEHLKRDLTDFKRMADSNLNERLERSEGYYSKISEDVFQA